MHREGSRVKIPGRSLIGTIFLGVDNQDVHAFLALETQKGHCVRSEEAESPAGSVWEGY